MTDPAPQTAPQSAPETLVEVFITVQNIPGDLFDRFDVDSIKAHLSPATQALMAANGISGWDGTYRVRLKEDTCETFSAEASRAERIGHELTTTRIDLGHARRRVQLLEHVLSVMGRDPELGAQLAELVGV